MGPTPGSGPAPDGGATILRTVVLEKEFEEYAKTQMESQRRQRRTQARYLLGLVKKYRGESAEARRLMEEAVKLESDFLGPRLELRGDVVDKLGS